MPNRTSEWLRAYEAKGYHPQATKAIGEALECERESELHDFIIEYCSQHDLPYYHSRMDKKTTGNIGAPDFFIFFSLGRTMHVEAKRRGKKPSNEQLAYHAWLWKKDHRVYVVHDQNEFTEAVKSFLEATCRTYSAPSSAPLEP